MKAIIDVRKEGIFIENCLIVYIGDEQPVTALKIDPSSPHHLEMNYNIINGNYKKSILLRLYLWWDRIRWKHHMA
jgi:hypothetical protein